VATNERGKGGGEEAEKAHGEGGRKTGRKVEPRRRMTRKWTQKKDLRGRFVQEGGEKKRKREGKKRRGERRIVSGNKRT